MTIKPFAPALALAGALLGAAASWAGQPVADSIYLNGAIWTGDADRAAAEALAVSGDRLLAVGSNAEVRELAGEQTRVVDLEGRMVVPGFQDSHMHPLHLSRYSVDVAGAETLEEFQQRIEAFAERYPDLPWIVGHGWGYSVFPDNKPLKEHIDAVVPDRPVYITSRDGHMGLANSRAIELAGIDSETPDPPNGRIERDAKGVPSGEFKESAGHLLESRMPAESDELRYQSLLHNTGQMAAAGLTAIQDANTDLDDVPLYRRAADSGELPLRVRFAPTILPGVGVAPDDPDTVELPTEADLQPYLALTRELQGPYLRAGAVKGMLDGTVDAQTASMFEPYTGSSHRGIPMWKGEDLNRVVALYDRLGIQVLLHAIGDKAIDMSLDAFEFAAAENGDKPRRHRIEHVEVPRLEDLQRMHDANVVVSTQPMFANPDATVLTNFEPLLGEERAPIADSFSLFDRAGVRQAFGSDWPVMPFEPLRGIYVAVTRMTPEGEPPGGWFPEGRISVEAALRHYTIDGAYAAFSEQDSGSLAPGKYADFVVLSQNLLAIDPMDILETEVLLTVMGGRVTHRSEAF